MKKLQKQNRNTSSKRSLSMANADNGSTPSGIATKKKKNDHPWLDVPAFDQKGEELMQENVSQLRKVCRAARADHALIKDLMKKTYPLRRRMVLAGKETVESILKSFPPLAQPAHVSYYL